MRSRSRLIVIIGICMLLMSVASADIPTMIGYQGILTDSEGQPVTEDQNITFTIYDMPSDGSVIWSETQTVSFDEDGHYNVLLGSVNSISHDVFAEPVRWLGVQVEGDDEMTPRFRIVSAAYSNRIATVDGSEGGSIVGNLNVSGKATIGPANTNNGDYAFVAGTNNTVNGNNGTVGGGINNSAGGNQSTVGGGDSNSANGLQSTVAGGYAGAASGESSTIGGGWHNTASGAVATVAGGQQNTASGAYSAIPGGANNEATGINSLAAGSLARSLHSGTFVWSDNTGSEFTSTGVNQFLIRAAGGVGIGINSPTAALHVNGVAKSVVGGVEFFMVPRGAIIMWNGSLTDIPSGWALCNGTNSTPDLQNRFIYGWGSGHPPGETGGSSSHNHSVSITATPLGLAGTPVAWPGTYYTSTSSHIPPYYRLAFLMKL